MAEHNSILAIKMILGQLQDVLGTISNRDYTAPLDVLSGATLGQHTRHISDMFLRLQAGYESGEVNYDKRERATETEMSPTVAGIVVSEILESLNHPEKPLVLSCENPFGAFSVKTTYRRELQYCLEHTIHHMALMKVGMQGFTYVKLPVNFGVAFSTIFFKNASS